MQQMIKPFSTTHVLQQTVGGQWCIMLEHALLQQRCDVHKRENLKLKLHNYGSDDISPCLQQRPDISSHLISKGLTFTFHLQRHLMH